MNTQKRVRNAPNIIKVVNLKRFLPDILLETKPKLKRTLHNPTLNTESSCASKEISDTHTNNNNAQKPVIEAKEVLNATEEPSEVQTSESYEHQLVARRKITFRTCSHSPKELSSLREHVDETLVKVGDTFESRDIFRQYLNDNAKRWHYYYVCRNSKKKIIEYNCICMAYNNKQREVVIRRQKERTTACPCKIRLTIDQCTSKVVAYYVCNHHDHEVTASAFHHYPHAKYLPQHVKEEFLDLAYIGLDVDLIQKYINSVIGLTIKKKDIWSYAYRFKRKIFQRSLTDERKTYIEELKTRIRETYGESIGELLEKPSEHTEVIDTVEAEPKRRKSLSKQDKNENTIIDTPTINDINISHNEEDSLLNEVLGNNNKSDTEIIVQYINMEGILCDEHGTPITNSSAIMQFINNSYVTPQNSEKDEFIEGTIFSEFVDSIHEEIYPIDWESIQTKFIPCNVFSENAPYDNEAEGSVLKDDIAEEISTVRTDCSQDDAVTTNDSDQIRRLSPTPECPVVYADMDNFQKYYYTDHRYIHCEKNSDDQTPVKRNTKRTHRGSNFKGDRDAALEEYIKAPEFVYRPTSLRHCTGHDDLTLLADADAILPGAKFLTHDVFLTYINERANRWYFYYSLVESGKAPENYVYKCVYGKHRVSKNAYRAKGLRKRNKLTTQCPCQIRLRRLDSDPAYLTVLYSCNHHDHALDQRQFTAQPHSRRLPQHIKEEIKDLLSLNVGTDVLRKYVAHETGVMVYGKYFHNVRVGMRRDAQRLFTEERLQALTKKIRDLEAIYGNAAKENPQTSVVQNQTRKRKLPLQVQREDRFTQAGLDEVATQTLEYYELSDKDDFAEEVCIGQADTSEDTTNRSRLETRLQNLLTKDILLKVKKLQESVRCDSLRRDLPNTTFLK